MKTLFLCELVDLVREGAAIDGDTNLKVRDIKPLALPLHAIMAYENLKAWSISAVSVRDGGTGFARAYVAIQTGDAAGGMVATDPGQSDEALAKIAVRMITGEGMKQVAVLDVTL